MRVELTFDDKDWQTLLDAWKEPAVKKTLKSAASAWGRKAKPILKAATPVAKPGNAYATGPGNLRNLVRSKQIRSGLGIGVVVASMGKGAYYRRWVVGGTKPHVILPKAAGSRGQVARAIAVAGGYARVVHHPGAKPNDYVSRAFPAAERAGNAAAEGVIFDGLAARRIAQGLDDL